MAQNTHTPITGEELAHAFEEDAPPVALGHFAFEDWLTLIVFWMMALAVIAQFITRYVLNDSFAWTEEVATYCLVAVVFLGSVMCVRISRHIQVDFLYRYVPKPVARTLSTLVDLLRIGFFAYGATLVYRYASLISDERMTTVDFPKSVLFYTVLAAFVLMALRGVQVAIANFRRGYSVLENPQAFDGTGV